MSVNNILTALLARKNLKEKEAYVLFSLFMSGKLTSSQMAAILTALKIKGETSSEITGAAKAMRAFATKVSVPGKTIDTCGTGGSGLASFNISTAAAFVLAGCGLKVLKHGNRSISSQCGSADVLERLGVRIMLKAREVEKSVKKANIGFMFAPAFHGSMKHVAPTRKELGFRTIFNLLGPLSNPARPDYQIIGVYDKELLGTYAASLTNLGIKRALIVHGSDGLDEITLTGPTKVVEIINKRKRFYTLNPRDFGFKKGAKADYKGKKAKENAQSIKRFLKGDSIPQKNIILANAAAALVITGEAVNFKEGVLRAKKVIEEKKAEEALKKMIDATKA